MDSVYIFSESRAEYGKLTQSFLSEKWGWMSESFMADFFPGSFRTFQKWIVYLHYKQIISSFLLYTPCLAEFCVAGNLQWFA